MKTKLGRASVHIEWNENGKLNVYHGTERNMLLASKKLTEKDSDDWDKLWNFLTQELKLKR